MVNSGIYKWTNLVTGMVYIGQAVDLVRRQIDFMHFNSRYAGNRINEEREKYPSLEYWKYDVLIKCDKGELDRYEREFIDKYDNNILLNSIFVNKKYVKEKNSNKRKVYKNLEDNVLKGDLTYEEYFNRKIEENRERILEFKYI